jgi:phosphate transport system protein
MKRKVSVIGLGYVGLPVAVAFGKKSQVIGCDISKSRLAELAARMTGEATEAFVNGDAELARKVVLSDPEADGLKRAVEKELVEDYMMKDGSTADRAVPLLLAARHLERVADHAVSMAEDIIYMVDARVVRHHPEALGKRPEA